jgi:hypothetical protein
MALVTMEQAKAHLRVTSDDHNADIELKIAQAGGIILDYLKGRANESTASVTVATSSIASPTVITTVAAHTLVNGSSVFISGHVGSTPDINGTWTISNVLASSFTIPVNVTIAGTGGTASLVWDDASVPGQVQSATLLMLAHLYEHRGDDQKTDEALWLAIERLLMRSRDPAFA